MSLRICPLASGSSGNCTYVATGRAGILVDAGLSARETGRRLAEIGVDLATIRAILVTHEHADHVAGLDVLHRRHGIPLYANSGTMEAVQERDPAKRLAWRVFATGTSFQIEDMEIHPFSVPHDAFDPVGFIIAAGTRRAGIVTDIGATTVLVRERLRDCDVIILESNHDEQMLRDADRPWALKQRILGRHGHLSNSGAAELVAEIAGPRLQRIYLCHLSADCNRPEVALAAAADVLAQRGAAHITVTVAHRDRVSEMWAAE